MPPSRWTMSVKFSARLKSWNQNGLPEYSPPLLFVAETRNHHSGARKYSAAMIMTTSIEAPVRPNCGLPPLPRLRLTGGTTPVVPWSVDSMRFCSLIEGTSAA